MERTEMPNPNFGKVNVFFDVPLIRDIYKEVIKDLKDLGFKFVDSDVLVGRDGKTKDRARLHFRYTSTISYIYEYEANKRTTRYVHDVLLPKIFRTIKDEYEIGKISSDIIDNSIKVYVKKAPVYYNENSFKEDDKEVLKNRIAFLEGEVTKLKRELAQRSK